MVGNDGIPGADPPPPLEEILEGCLGCKWTLHVIGRVRAGVTRPGALEKTAGGLTAKVLNERLVKLVRFGILRRTSHPEIPPRVEYDLTPFGARLADVLDQIERLRADFGG
jgi:DNA-binding HxlR family transcriptional regulator